MHGCTSPLEYRSHQVKKRGWMKPSRTSASAQRRSKPFTVPPCHRDTKWKSSLNLFRISIPAPTLTLDPEPLFYNNYCFLDDLRTFSLQGIFLCTRVFLSPHWTATNVLQLPDPSTQVSFGVAAYSHMRSQKPATSFIDCYLPHFCGVSPILPHRISKRLNAMTAIPPKRPNMLSCPFP